MTAPQTIDTDALRKLWQAVPYKEPFGRLGTGDADAWQKVWDFACAARRALPAILDELDRLRAAEAASKARVERPERRVSNQRLASMIYELSKQPSEPRYLPALRDLHDARAEIARLTDAGAVATSAGIVPVHTDYSVYPNKTTCAAVAPPPPAAADRGAPGQRVSEEELASFLARTEAPGLGTAPTHTELYRTALDLRDCRAALATAPKAEDVRREALMEVHTEAQRYAEFYSQHSDGRNTFIIFADWIWAKAKESGQ